MLVASGLVDAELSGDAANDQLIGGAGDDACSAARATTPSRRRGRRRRGPEPGDRGPRGDGAGPGESESAVDAGADTFAGGAGFDTFDYATRVASVTATLDGQPNDGEADERDNVGADVEALIGGRGADTLTGTRARSASSAPPATT